MIDLLGNTINKGDRVYFRATNQNSNIEKYQAYLDAINGVIPMTSQLNYHSQFFHDLTHSVEVVQVGAKTSYVQFDNQTKRVFPYDILLDDGAVYDAELDILAVGDRIAFSNSLINSGRTMMTATIDGFLGQAVHITDVSKKNFPRLKHSSWLLPMITKKIS